MQTIRSVNISLEIFGGLLSLIIIFCLMAGRNEKNRLYGSFIKCVFCNVILLLSDAASWHFKGGMEPYNRYVVSVSNFLVFILGYILLAFFTGYLVCYISERRRVPDWPVKLMWGLTATAVLLVIVSQFNHMYYIIDENNLYRRGPLFWLSQAFGIVGMAMNGVLIIRYRKSLNRRETVSLLSYIFLPACAIVIQIFFYGVQLLHTATSICILCIYIMMQVEQAERFRKREQEIEQKKIELMLGQIQPHFLYNSLATIRSLCEEEPEQARDAIQEFSNFLRGNMNSLTCKGLVSFTQELQYTKNYLALEKRRYRDRLQVVYSIKEWDFMLPPLTLQPIVENAVHYGAGKKEGGGRVWIGTWKQERDSMIEVKDDGDGFSGESAGGSGKRMGLENVRKRLEAMCGGALEVRSVPKNGTCVRIRIPSGGKDVENSCYR